MLLVERLAFLGERMEQLHFHEIKAVELVQRNFMENKELMQFVSHLGGPDMAFLLYFPLVYFFSQAVGLKILWAAVFSEWLNASLKWLLFGHRPYWWVRETSLYNNQNRPDIEQFPSTCETGPGSPSGHMMVTAAVWFIIVKAVIDHLRATRERAADSLPFIVDVLLWYAFGVFLFMVGVGRVFIATHFPNQVVLGLGAGILIGHIVSQFPVHTFTLLNYLTGSMFLLQAVFYQYFVMFLMGLSPDWSITLAAKWCADPSWVRLNTTPFYSVSRDIGVLFCTGLAQRYIASKSAGGDSQRGMVGSTALAVTSVILVHSLGLLQLPTKFKSLFYVLGACKEGLIPVTVIGLNVLYEKTFSKAKMS